MSAHDSYLETMVLSATPQRLRLLLIEGALRSARQTLAHWEEGRNEAGFESLIRCRRIVAELLSTARERSPLAVRVAEVYSVLFRTLTQAQQGRDRELLGKVISVLEIESETWRRVCEELPDAPAAPRETGEITSQSPAIPLDQKRLVGQAKGSPAGAPSLSLEI